ncbi:bifunctional helix-turn-helix transcriptional regulator/GNAT family N-acetyltransferase [Paenibacillus glycanilyticus]|uniref:HTH-type DNA-binding domain-containing acetyltransferase YbfA n=1 Tax=Paenibacillus glycanilyticus TaxID=126569 RepID=A0ABQ6G6Q0_9BACL|nr:helix-turn-helix domain-containing GNAT family N-acetyltransferase [Paenibacillus glycanilyticus]GLX66634.1 putative HTH-type DNA-binding domain-containing acetyltransferase YbfA [Paenibacillus glycanilyticus]
MTAELSIIQRIRKFNRFYTKILGLLDKHLLDSDYSLSEVRVLFEIGNTEQVTAKMLTDQLRMDAGYLSRILKRFDKLGFTYRVQSGEDGRSSFLHLTKLGEETLSSMNALSNDQIRSMVSGLSKQTKNQIAKSMTTIENALSDQSAELSIRTDLQPGDAGMLIHMHGWIYARDCGYNHVFEGYVCKTFYDFLLSYNPDKERIWIAEVNGEIVGSIAIVHQSDGTGQLRWFILHPDYRSMGIGKKLFNEAIHFSKEKGFTSLFLETTDDQETAIGMYKKAGFKKISEQENNAWGKRHMEQTYELQL